MPEGQSRRLAAILAADIAGYSALMGADEARTVSDLKGHQAVVLPMVGDFGGRIIDTAGDGILAEFSSVVNAVECAVAIQRAMAERNTTVEPVRRMQFRIGINLGDVIYDSERIFGDGINIAARLEGIAEPGGICVSAKVRDEIDGKMNFAYRDLGDRHLKNIARPVRAYGIRLDAAPAQPAPAAPPQPDDRPSIAVLPFTNMSGDPEQEYFSDGISDDIITDLSKIGGLTVIARNSSFTYKGRAVDVRTVGRELAVRSVLEGSIRRAGQRVRITAQLIDTASGGHVWAERYDRDLTDIFAVQDDVTHRIVEALKVTLSPAENARLADSGTSNIEAYDCYLRGRELLGAPVGIGKTKNREALEQSTKLFMRALELDRSYSLAYAGLSMAYNLDYQNRWSDDPDSSLPLSKRYAELAVEKNPKEPFARLCMSWAAIFEKDLDRAKSEAETALSCNPNYASAYAVLGTIHTYLGRPLEAIAMIERATRLDPAASKHYLHFLGTAYLLAGKYETAAVVLRRRVFLVPGTDFSRALLASALGHLGDVDDARRVWHELKEINPKYSFREHFSRRPFRQEDVETVAEGLTKAGLPN
jgi:adenylate cyclase